MKANELTKLSAAELDTKLKELKEKVDAMPNPEEIYGDDDK